MSVCNAPLVSIAAVLIGMAHGGVSAQPAAPIDRLAWLAGCWAGERAAGREGEAPRRIEEQWMAPRAGLMLGMARTLKGDALADYEHMLIRDEAGTLVFTAQPQGQPKGSFSAVALDAEGTVFENVAHDFPQRVSYRRQADGSLLARIEGVVQGQRLGIDFPMRRVACPG